MLGVRQNDFANFLEILKYYFLYAILFRHMILNKAYKDVQYSTTIVLPSMYSKLTKVQKSYHTYFYLISV